MRLEPFLKDKIKKYIKQSFGDVDIYLFGSRVDDKKNGGDIDIAIDCDLDKESFFKNRVKFKTMLFKDDIDIKIDIVQYHNDDKLLSSEIRENSILL